MYNKNKHLSVIAGYVDGGLHYSKLRSPKGSNLYICTDIKGVIQFVDGPAIHYLGYKVEQLLGNVLASYIPSEDLLTYDSLLDSNNDRAEFRLYRADGSFFYGEMFVHDVYDEQGKHSGFCFRMYDITSRMNEIFRLVEQDDQFRAIVDNTRDLILVYKGYDILYANAAALQKLGYTMAELRHKGYYHLFAENDRGRIEEFDFVKGNEQAENWSIEASIDTAFGNKLECEIDIKPILYDGGQAFMALFHDVTEYKKATKELIAARQEAESANQIKADFLAMMSHGIRTPMDGVIGMTSLLLNTPLTERQLDYIETIKVSGELLIDNINDILDFTKMESGELKLEEAPFELEASIEETLDLLALKAMRKGLDLLYIIEPDVSPMFIGDSGRLGQILFNLVNNAIKFTERGEVLVLVKKIKETEDCTELHFDVRDTGIGIEPSRLPHIFEAFAQDDISTTRKFAGTGLGLANAKRLALLMGGDIRVESEINKGTTFNFAIKLKKSSDINPKLHVKGDLAKLKGQTVLIVDDNKTSLQILKLHFEYWGMKVLLSESGAGALTLMKGLAEKPAMAVFDLHMPEMGGIELASKFKSDKSLSETPLLLMSSTGDTEVIPKNYFVSRLSKPIKLRLLFDEVFNIFTELTRISREKKAGSSLDRAMGQRLPLNILIAEDNMVNLKLAVTLLNMMGYRADSVMNGKEALEILEKKEYDIIFMDVQMPEMDGIEATEMIIKTIPVEKQPLVIAVTANSMAGDREKCLEVGMVDYLSKPIRIIDLQNTIEKWGSYTGLENPRRMLLQKERIEAVNQGYRSA